MTDSNTKNDFNRFAQAASDPAEYELFFFESLVEKNPDLHEALFPLAELYTYLGYFEKGLTVDTRLSQLFSDDPSVWYNLACSLSLCNKCTESIDALKRSLEIGFSNFELIQTDPDLNNIRSTNEYKNLFKDLLNNMRE